MRKLEPLKYLAGSIFIYYVMAACSAPAGSSGNNGGSSSGGGSGGTFSSSGATSNGSGGASGSGGSGGGSSGGGSGGSSGSPVPDANADTSQSGSRLKASYYVGADGSKQFAYFTDSARANEQCVFSSAGDGTIRCLPSGAYLIATEFADSSCSIEVGETTTCASPHYVVQTAAAGTGCGYATHVYTAGSGVTNLYVRSGGNCISAGAPPAGYTYVTVGAEVAPSSFQQATIQVQ